MFTVQQIAERLGIRKIDTIYQLISSGQLAATNIAVNPAGRPCWRISPDDFEAFLAQRAARPPVKAKRRKSKQQAEATQYF